MASPRFFAALTLSLTLLLGPSTAVSLADHDDRGRTAEYIVQMAPGSTPAEGRDMVAELGGRVTSPELPVINGFGAMLEDDEADELSRRAGVKAVTPNGATRRGEDDEDEGDDDDAVSGAARCSVAEAGRRSSYRSRMLDVSPLESLRKLRQPLHSAIRGDLAWTSGFTGQGVRVAVVDTGIAGDLGDFDRNGQSRVIASAVTNPCATDADDSVGHGTHVAGLIAANSLNNSAAGKERGRYMGVAPGADLISVKVSDDTGDTTVLDVIHGLQFVVDHRADLGIRVVNLSLSSSVAESYRTDPLDAAVEAAWFAGVVVVAAAGNDGTAPNAVSFAPGNDPYVITAGAFDDGGTSRRDDDRLAPWSSRGLTQDGVQKPDVLAPGTRLVAPLAPRSGFPRLCKSCTVGKRYFRLSGTSMAAAVVSGTAALMLEKNPGMTPDEVKGAIAATGRDIPGAGLALDAYAALDGHGSANAGLEPSGLIDPGTGSIDWARASFRRASFRDASGSPFAALWTRASFRCVCGFDASGEVDPQRASFRRVSFRRNVEFDR